MTLSKIGRVALAVVATAALGLGMTACGGGTIGYMWVLGTYYNQISGFTIDDYTGNLTAITHSPFSSGGTNPVTVLVKPGGRFLFVINAGSGATGTPGSATFTSPGESIAVFSVGGGGTLTFEQSYDAQGVQPVWGTLDSTGNFLYVVDKYSPDYKTTGNGAITAFSIDGSTGRLTLVPNQAVLQPGTQVPTTYFEIGPNPIMSKIGGGNCLFTLEPNTVYPYSVNSSSGQLTTVTTGPYLVTGSNTLTSINTSTGSSAASFTFLTDGPGNQIFSLQAGGTACSLQPISGSQQTNLSGTYNPVNSLTSSSGKFLYVLNNAALTNPLVNANSTISAFTIDSQGQLSTLADSINNPYAVGSGPTCIVQDPSNQYMYITDQNDSTVTGKLLNQNSGYLSDLARGSVFTVTMKPSCMAVSGNL
jgi:6-phosphogluconolactonase